MKETLLTLANFFAQPQVRFSRPTSRSFYNFLIFIILAAVPSLSSARQILLDISKIKPLLATGMIHAVVAEELCDCLFVVGLGAETNSNLARRLDMCSANSGLASSSQKLNSILTVDVSTRPGDVVVESSLIGLTVTAFPNLLGLFSTRKAVARFDGEDLGCRILTNTELWTNYPENFGDDPRSRPPRNR